MFAKLLRNYQDCRQRRRERGWWAVACHAAHLLKRPYLRARIRFFDPEQPRAVPRQVQTGTHEPLQSALSVVPPRERW